MCHMKTISLRELHANTGAWVHSASRLGAVLVTDRGRVIARIEPVAEDSAGNPFLKRRVLPEFAALKGRLGGGTDSTALVRVDRDRGLRQGVEEAVHARRGRASPRQRERAWLQGDLQQ